MSIADIILGRPLATKEEHEQRIKTLYGIPELGLDALGSAAYGPEAAMTILMPLGVGALGYIGPITIAILAILAILYFSYRQTIHAYPNGGGSYTVASENLGRLPGLIAAASLMLDYILDVCVGISAGVGALISAVPSLHSYILPLCLGILALIALVNLRGVREPGLLFCLPTYLFVATLFAVIAWGLVSWMTAGGHPHPVVAPPAPGKAVAAVSVWLLLRAFASGCTAMTGVEAVSNGIIAFAEPGVKYAERTLTAICAILGVLLGGLAFLTRVYGVNAMDQEKPGYQSLISQLVGAVAGHGAFYYVTLFSVLAVLALSANTGFADFPRLCRLLGEDRFLPYAFAERGRRLVFTGGIVALAIFAAVLLTVFGGVTDRLIPLFAIGAFGAFTLSQAGMVVHWKRHRGRGWYASMVVNGLGAVTTGAALVIVIATKFVDGAWITLILIPALVLLFARIHHHYERVGTQTACERPFDMTNLRPPVVVIPIGGWNTIAQKALRFALLLSEDVHPLYVAVEDEKAEDVKERWKRMVEEPLEKEGRQAPDLEILQSPYRRIIPPLLRYIDRLKDEFPDRMIVVVIPELVKARWYEYLLHNQRASMLKARLYFAGGRHVVVVNVPWYLGEDPKTC